MTFIIHFSVNLYQSPYKFIMLTNSVMTVYVCKLKYWAEVNELL